jgi:hypothetical protein
MPAIDTGYTDSNAGSLGVSTFDADDEYCNSVQDEDTALTTDTQSLSDNTVINLPDDDGSVAHVASFVSFDANGWTWNFSATEGTIVKYWALAIEETPPVVTIPSFHQAKNISINIYTPTIGSYTPRGVFEGEVGKNVNSYSHTIAAVGGYLNSSFTIFDRLNNLEDWLLGVGRHVEVYNPSLDEIWEGFVNRVTLNVGALSVVRGPLTSIANRVEVVYSSVDTSVNPPVFGVRDRTPQANDTTSQDRYGIIQKVLSVGGTTESEATQIRDTWLSENAEVETSQQFNNQSVAQPSVTIECFGYVYFLNLFTYNQTANTGDINVSTQIENTISADPNGLFSTDFSGIDTNTLQVKRFVNDDNKGWDYIKSLTAQGDASDNRYTFGIYNDRKAIYTAQPTDTAYFQRIADPKVRVETPTGLEVKPWNVTASRWLFYPDVLIGKSPPANKRDDPRYEFIETLSFSIPWNLTHTGSKQGRLSQKLARLGLGGVG